MIIPYKISELFSVYLVQFSLAVSIFMMWFITYCAGQSLFCASNYELLVHHKPVTYGMHLVKANILRLYLDSRLNPICIMFSSASLEGF